MSDCDLRPTITPLIALGCMYYTKGIGLLDDFLTIEGNQVNIMILANWCNEVYRSECGAKRLDFIVSRSKEMAKLFEDNIMWNNEQEFDIPKIPFPTGIESWNGRIFVTQFGFVAEFWNECIFQCIRFSILWRRLVAKLR